MLRSFLLIFALAALAGCSPQRDPWKDTPAGQPRVLASFPPLYCFTANVAKDHAKVLCLLTGTGPHEYEPTDADARKVAGAQLYFVNGLGLDQDFTKSLLRTSRNHKLKPEAIGDALDRTLFERMGDHDHDAMDEHHHHHGEYDPHIWLGPKQAQAMVAVIAQKLAEHDPAHKADFAKNADEYLVKLKDLEAYGREQFKDKKSKSLITMHESLRYFAKGFGLDLVDSIQPRPGVEADANKLAKLIDVCKAKNVSVIAVEPQFSRAQADSLARVLRDKGLNIQVVLVDPLETAPPVADGNPDPGFYLDRMKANIDALAKAFP